MPFSSRKQPIGFIIGIKYETTQARMFKKKKNGCGKNAPAAAGSRGRNFIPTLDDPPTQVVTRPPLLPPPSHRFRIYQASYSHTDAILLPYSRVWLHYGISMASPCHILAISLPYPCQIPANPLPTKLLNLKLET